MKPPAFPKYLSASILILAACAVKENPPGGPEDKTPPSVVSIRPEAGSTAISPETVFRIVFSEPMEQTGTQGAIFISPVFWDYPTFEWSGKQLTLTPPQPLRPNTTYILTIGAGATDSHRNKMGKSLTFAFSTGTSIDSGAISGVIYSEQRVLYDIWAYGIDDTSGTDFWLRIPDHVTQVDSTGAFSIQHIGAGKYLVVGVDDTNDDLFWDPSAEALGLPSSITTLSRNQDIRGLVIRPERRDTTTSYITRVTPVNRQRVSIEFSQMPREALTRNSNSYLITWSDGDSVLGIGMAYIGEENNLLLETAPQRPGEIYQLKGIGLFDAWGIPFDTSASMFTGTDRPDTTSPRLLMTIPPNNSTSAYQDSVVEMTFSERLNILQFNMAVTVIADSVDTLGFLPAWITPNQVRLRFRSRLPRQRQILIRLASLHIQDMAGNAMRDSNLAVSFRLPRADTVGSVLAELSPVVTPAVGSLVPIDAGGDSYKKNFNQAGILFFEAVMPGNYRLEYFEDSDNSGEWSPGMIFPFKPAERFSFLPDTLVVRSRWTTEVGSVSLPQVAQ